MANQQAIANRFEASPRCGETHAVVDVEPNVTAVLSVANVL